MSAPRDLERIGREITAIRDRLRLALCRPLIDFIELETLMSVLDDTTAALATAVNANTTATNELIAALATASPTAEQIAAITAQTQAVTANTTAITAALTPPAAAEPEPAPQ